MCRRDLTIRNGGFGTTLTPKGRLQCYWRAGASGDGRSFTDHSMNALRSKNSNEGLTRSAAKTALCGHDVHRSVAKARRFPHSLHRPVLRFGGKSKAKLTFQPCAASSKKQRRVRRSQLLCSDAAFRERRHSPQPESTRSSGTGETTTERRLKPGSDGLCDSHRSSAVSREAWIRRSLWPSFMSHPQQRARGCNRGAEVSGASGCVSATGETKIA
jgi:hypothetical protein